jgi:hypothetical protein
VWVNVAALDMWGRQYVDVFFTAVVSISLSVRDVIYGVTAVSIDIVINKINKKQKSTALMPSSKCSHP